jgi:hypothetical protein
MIRVNIMVIISIKAGNFRYIRLNYNYYNVYSA